VVTLMEKIVRPYVPIDTGPGKERPQCREEPGSTTLRFKAPAGLAGGGGKRVDLKQPTRGTPSNPFPPQDEKNQEKSKNSSWAYAYKKYMTKVEVEEDKCKEDDAGAGVVGGGTTDSPPAGGGSGSGGDEGTGTGGTGSGGDVQGGGT
jgi:hypothetical protein